MIRPNYIFKSAEEAQCRYVRPCRPKRSDVVSADESINSASLKRITTIALWLFILLAGDAAAHESCPVLVLQDDTIASEEIHFSCEIRVDPDYIGAGTGDLTLVGTLVSFGDGFEVQNLGSLTVVSSDVDSATIYSTRVHPIWGTGSGGQGCITCHTSSHWTLNLTISATATCQVVRYWFLDDPSCTSNGSRIISVPRNTTGTHTGGTHSCFATNGSSCADAILNWCNSGAECT